MTDAEHELAIRPYSPFPDFSVWSERTSVSPLVERFQEEFRRLRENSGDGGAALRERATTWAAIDTGAIEGLYDVDRGFTISVAANVALLQAIRSSKGESVERAVGDALAAYELVLDLATRREPVTEAGIRALHAVVVRSQDSYRVITAVGPQDQPLSKGTYKTQDNHPLHLATNTVHSYAPVIDTPAEMARLVAELRTPAFAEASPVLQAAYVHYAFIAVHPFADGNGRVGRALASTYLYREPGLPLVVFSDEKPEYLAALESADEGRFQPLVSFVGDRLIDTVNLLKGPQGLDLPPVPEQADALSRELNGRGGYSHSDVDAGALRLLEAFHRRLTAALESAHLDDPITGAVARIHTDYSVPAREFRVAVGEPPVVLRLRSAPPATADVQVTYVVGIAKGLSGDVDYVLHSAQGEQLDVFLREVLPRVTRTLELRLDDYAEASLRRTMTRLGEQARAALKSKGYS